MVDKIFGGPMSSAWPRSPDSQQRKRKPRDEGEAEDSSSGPEHNLTESLDSKSPGSPGLVDQGLPSSAPASAPLPDTGASIHIDEYA